MAHILLIHPDSSYKKINFSLTLASLGGALKEAGHTVNYILFDLPWNWDWNPDKVLANIDLVGITVSSCDFDAAIDILKKIKKANSTVPIIAGGAHATFAPESLLEKGFDLVVRGEGEYTLLEVVQAYGDQQNKYQKFKEIAGISYMVPDGQTIHQPDKKPLDNLDSLPLPDWYQDDYARILKEHSLTEDAAEISVLPDANTYSLMIESSRGCPYKCIFCTTSKIKGKRWRAKSSERIMAEYHHFRHFYQSIMKGQSKSPSIMIQFPDDNFCLDEARVRRFCQKVNDLPEKSRPLWTNMARANKIRDVDLLKTMVKAGCIRIFIGAECGYAEGLKKIKKGITLDMIHDAVDAALEAKLPVLIISWIFGFPWESRIQGMQTIVTALQIGFKARAISQTSVFTFTPIVGADITATMDEHNRGQISDHARYDSWGFNHPHMNDQDLFELQMVARWLSYLIEFKGHVVQSTDLKKQMEKDIKATQNLVLNTEDAGLRKIFLQMNRMLTHQQNCKPVDISAAIKRKIPRWLNTLSSMVNR